MKKLFAFCLIMLFATTVVAEQLRIHWTPSTATNVVRNVIYRSTSESTGFVAIDSLAATGPGDTLYTDVNVPAGTRYYYRMRCVTSDGQRSSLSTSVVSGTYLLTTDVQSVKVVSVLKIASGTYVVTWTSTVPTAGYLRFRVGTAAWTSDGFTTMLATTHTSTLFGLAEPARYEFKANGYTSAFPIYLTTSVSYFSDMLPVPQPPTLKAIYPL